MNMVLPLLAVAAAIAALAAWHGATGSEASRAALWLLPVALALGSMRQRWRRLP